jgi:DNA polymerase-3 subunit gamma/tau
LGVGHVTVDRVRDALGLVPEDEFLALLDLVLDRRAGDVFSFVGRLADAGIDFALFLSGFADTLRAQLAILLGGDMPDLPDRVRTALAERSARWSAADLLRMLSAIGELEPRFRKSGQQQLLVETLLVRFALLDRTVEIEELLRGLNGEGGESSVTPRRPSSSPRPAPDAPRRPSRDSSPRPTVDSTPAAPPSTPEERSVPTKPSNTLADVAAPAAPQALGVAREPLDINRLTGRWDEIASQLRADGKRMLASALEHALPSAVTASGDITIELDATHEYLAPAVESGRADIIAALRQRFPDVRSVRLRQDPERAAVAPARVTDEMVRNERLNALRKRDPILGAAIDTLDLDVVE